MIEYFIKEKLKFGNNDIKDVYTISSSALSLILLMDVNISKFEEEVFVTELGIFFDLKLIKSLLDTSHKKYMGDQSCIGKMRETRCGL